MALRNDTGYLVGLIGSGIGTSLSPALLEREADALGVRYLYRLLDLDDLGLPATAVGDLVTAARLAGTLHVFDVDTHRATALTARLSARFGAGRAVPLDGADALADAMRDTDGLTHATPTGMVGHPGMPLPTELLRPGLWVADIVYRPLETELLGAARERGCRVLTGGPMAVYQAADAFRIITGREPDTGRMRHHFDTLCTQNS